MRKSSTVNARIESDLKDKAERIFHQLGLTTKQAITLFYKQVGLKNGFPFVVTVPNKITLKKFIDTDAGRDLIICDDTDDMFRKLKYDVHGIYRAILWFE